MHASKVVGVKAITLPKASKIVEVKAAAHFGPLESSRG